MPVVVVLVAGLVVKYLYGMLKTEITICLGHTKTSGFFAAAEM